MPKCPKCGNVAAMPDDCYDLDYDSMDCSVCNCTWTEWQQSRITELERQVGLDQLVVDLVMKNVAQAKTLEEAKSIAEGWLSDTKPKE